MVDKATAPQFDAGPAGTVLNLHRLRPGVDEPSASFTPRALREHHHPTLQMSVLLHGTLAAVGWQTGGGKAAARRLRGGQAYVVPPDQPHDFRFLRPEGMVNFHICWDALAALDPARFEANPTLLDDVAVLGDPLLAGLAEGVHRAHFDAGGLTPLYLDAAWTLLAAHLARRIPTGTEDRTSTPTLLPPRRLRRALDHLEAHLVDNDLRTGDLAVAAGLSPVHFTRLFARTTGTSPMQFVIGRRLDWARELLRADSMPVAAIAFAVGFGSHARFSEAFRGRFGVTPSQARHRSPSRME